MTVTNNVQTSNGQSAAQTNKKNNTRRYLGLAGFGVAGACAGSE